MGVKIKKQAAWGKKTKTFKHKNPNNDQTELIFFLNRQ